MRVRTEGGPLEAVNVSMLLEVLTVGHNDTVLIYNLDMRVTSDGPEWIYVFKGEA